MWIFWLIICIAFSIAEMITNGFFLIWFSAGALAALITSFATNHVIIQTLVFLMTSTLLTLTLTKKFSHLFHPKSPTVTSIDHLIGQKGIVLEDIGPGEHSGLVKLDGEVWTALSSNKEPLTKGSTVVADQIKGVRLFVSLHKSS